ncbi:transposase [Trichonephila clavipes]|nr:transposase [Trichonephila clavipes]
MLVVIASAQELKIDHKTVLNHLRKVEFKKKFDWDWKGINNYELLLYDQSLNLDICYQRLDCLKLAIDQKRPELAKRRGAVFHQDNARPYTSVVTRQKLWELNWEVLMHPPYSQDLAPNDYDLFLALQIFLCDKKLGSREDWEN